MEMLVCTCRIALPKIRTDLIFDDDDDVAESLFIEVCIPDGKNIIIGIIYRPPNQNANSFLSKYNDIIGKNSNENKTCYRPIYIMGDFNLNLLNYDSHSLTCEFLDGMYSNMFIPLITCPTRITAHTSTLTITYLRTTFLPYLQVACYLQIFLITCLCFQLAVKA